MRFSRIPLPLAVLMFLFAVPSWAQPGPRILGSGHHPLVDRLLVAETSGVTHMLNPPVRREVVLTLDRPWEGAMSGYGTILRDEAGRVRLYYRGGGDVDPPEVTCVAFSDDGVSFTRPSLGFHQVRGTRDNNVVFTALDRPSYGESHNFSPFLDTSPGARPDARWKAVALKVAADGGGQRQRMLTVLGSPDGLRWKHLADEPVIRKGGFDSLNTAFFDRDAGRYVCYYRVADRGLRSFARASSDDFLSWRMDPPLVFRPPQDEQWYTNGVTPWPGVAGLRVALPMRFVPERKSIGDPSRKTDGLSDAVFMTSRDGVTWDRTFREAFIRPGPDSANWGDAHSNNTPLTGIVETAPGEWSVYWFEGSATGAKPRIRRGTVRAHGFVSVRAGAETGEFTTPRLRLGDAAAGAGLRVNYATSAAGFLRVEVLDIQGRRPLDGFSAADGDDLYGDETRRAVRWRGGANLPVGRDFRLRFVLKDADIYSLEMDTGKR